MIKRLKSLKNGLKIDFNLRGGDFNLTKDSIFKIVQDYFLQNNLFFASAIFFQNLSTNLGKDNLFRKVSTLCRKITQKLSTNFRKRQTAHLLQDCIITLIYESIGVVVLYRVC